MNRTWIFALLLTAAACSPTVRNSVPPGTLQPDQYLFDRGMQALNEKKWLSAREFFKMVTETYTQSPLRPDAKLGVGDTYLGEGTAEALVMAQNEFQEFLAFYPTNRRADYAQYKLAMTHHKQMRRPQNDQTETKNAVAEFENFVKRYPNSSLMPDAQVRLREARDRLSENEFLVGRFYYRIHWYPGAIDRLTKLIKEDPAYTGRDAVYFYLADSYAKAQQPALALPWFEKLVDEFEASEHLEEAKKRISELKAIAQAKASS